MIWKVIAGMLLALMGAAAQRDLTSIVTAQTSSFADKMPIIAGPDCTPTFDFAYLPPMSAVTINSPTRRGKYRNKLSCGWWLWSAPGYTITVYCKRMRLKNRDYLQFYDNEASVWTRVTNTLQGNVTYSFDTADLLMGITTNKKETEKGFECMAAAILPPPTLPPPPPPTPPPQDGCHCGVNAAASRIVGGTEAIQGSHPYIVAIKPSATSLSHYCGGTLISDEYVITAAHCVDATAPMPWLSLGMHDTQNPSSYTTVRATDLFVHPMYDDTTVENDIAILRIPQIDFTEYINPACLPDDLTETYAGQNGTVAGWGTTQQGGSLSQFLMEVDIPILPNDLCADMYGVGQIFPNMICAADLIDGGEDSCQGDSGGPMTVDDNGVTELAGVVSWGYGCADILYPGVYARVTSLMNFISYVTANETFCPRPSPPPPSPPSVV